MEIMQYANIVERTAPVAPNAGVNIHLRPNAASAMQIANRSYGRKIFAPFKKAANTLATVSIIVQTARTATKPKAGFTLLFIHCSISHGIATASALTTTIETHAAAVALRTNTFRAQSMFWDAIASPNAGHSPNIAELRNIEANKKSFCTTAKSP